MAKQSETIYLHNVEITFGHVSGTDADGNVWTTFRVDYMADQIDGECCICGAELSAGYMCMDGGDEVCHEHVTWTPADVVYDVNKSEQIQ